MEDLAGLQNRSQSQSRTRASWVKAKILTSGSIGTVHSSILNSDALVGRLFCYIAVDFQLIKGLAGLQTFSQSGNRTRDLWVKATNPDR